MMLWFRNESRARQVLQVCTRRAQPFKWEAVHTAAHKIHAFAVLCGSTAIGLQRTVFLWKQHPESSEHNEIHFHVPEDKGFYEKGHVQSGCCSVKGNYCFVPDCPRY